MAKLSDAIVQDTSELSYTTSVASSDSLDSLPPIVEKLEDFKYDLSLTSQQKEVIEKELKVLKDNLEDTVKTVRSSNTSPVEQNTDIFTAIQDYKKKASEVISKPIIDSFQSQSETLTTLIQKDLTDQVQTKISSDLNTPVSTDQVQTMDFVPLVEENQSDSSTILNNEETNLTVESDSVTYPVTVEKEELSEQADEVEAVTTESEPENTDNFVDSVKNAWSEGGAGVSRINELVDNYSNMFTSSEYWEEVGTDLMDSVTQNVSDVVRAASNAINDVMSNDVIGYIADPIGMVSDIMTSTMSQVSAGIQAVISSLSESVNELLDAVDSLYGPKMWKALLSDTVQGVTDDITDTIDNLARKALDELFERGLKYHDKNFGGFWEESDRTDEDKNDFLTKDNFTQVEAKTITRDKFKVLYEPEDKTLKDTNNLMISNDLFWNIDIVAYKNGESTTPPSLRGIYQVDDSGYLPIVSYSFSGDELKMTNFAVEGNVNFSIPLPSGVTKPSRISITLPELVYRNGDAAYACSQQFKKEYLNYIYVDTDDSKSLTVRDFRDCAYEITLTKYSPQWRKVGIWHLIGIPDISITEQGSSSSSAEFIELSFSIVGEKDLTNDEQATLSITTDEKNSEPITVVKTSQTEEKT